MHRTPSVLACFDATRQTLARAELHFGHGTDNADDEALWLLCHVLDEPVDERVLAPDHCLSESQQLRLDQLLALRLETKQPLAYLVQHAWFAGLKLFVDQRVLVPRSPLAELIEQQFHPWCRDPQQLQRIADLGTGSGCLALACAHYLPWAEVHAVDNSWACVEVATANRDQLGMQSRVQVHHGHLFSPLTGQFDLIISNPPYVPEAERGLLPAEYHAEPAGGLFAGTDGLDVVREILLKAKHYLSPNGGLVVEVGAQAEALQSAFPTVGFVWLEFTRGGEGVFWLDGHQVHSI